MLSNFSVINPVRWYLIQLERQITKRKKTYKNETQYEMIKYLQLKHKEQTELKTTVKVKI